MEAMEKAAKDPRAPMLRSDVRGVTTTAMPEGVWFQQECKKRSEVKRPARRRTLPSSLYQLDAILPS